MSKEDYTYYTLEVTTDLTQLNIHTVRRCVHIGLVKPAKFEDDEEDRFSELDLARLRKVRRLIQDVGLNWAGVEIVMRLTDELNSLHAELARLRGAL